MTRTIAVFTGTRADYGLLRGLALAIDASSDARLALLVSGTHLAGVHAISKEEISEDGLTPVEEVAIWGAAASPVDVARDTGSAVGRYAEALSRIEPDVLVVLGDRLEAVSVALAATVLGIPIAHIHGGEVTEGAMDDALRHSITKLSYLHFTSTSDHRRRVLQLGEAPERVHFFGAPIVDALAGMKLLDQNTIEARYGVRLDRPTALLTYHPASMDVRPPMELLEEMLAGLLAVDGLGFVVTGTNNDLGSEEVRTRLAEWANAHADRVDYVESFGQVGYLSTMSFADVVVGNSSSTVLEAPILGTPSVLIGDRQRGRPLAASVRWPKPERHSIARAIEAAVTGGRSPYRGDPFGTPGFAERALAVLLQSDLPRRPRKLFHDLECED